MRLEDKFKAIGLRRKGMTYSEIRTRIPNLSKGTLCGWVKNVELTKEQKKRILKKIKKGSDKARAIQRQKGAWTNHLKRIKETQKIILESKKEIKKLARDPFFLMGLMLYWAEGDKSLEYQRVKFSNSDPLMIELMMGWFRKYCGVSEKKINIELNIHTLLGVKKTKTFWSRVVKLPIKQMRIYTKPTEYSQKKNPNYKGTCSIRIHNVNLFRRIVTWRIEVLKKLGYKINQAPVAQWIEQVFSKH